MVSMSPSSENDSNNEVDAFAWASVRQ